MTEDAIEKVGGGYFENAHPERTQTFATVMSGFFAGVFGAAINTPADTIRSTIQKRVLMGKVDKAVTLIGWPSCLSCAIPYTLYLTPYTLYLILYTLYLTPYTLYLIPYTSFFMQVWARR